MRRIFPELHQNFSHGFSSLSQADFLKCTRLSVQFPESQAAFETILSVIGGFLYAATSSVKELPNNFLVFVNLFSRSKQKLYMYFSPQKSTKKNLKALTRFPRTSKNTYILVMPDNQLIDQWPPCFYAESL
jgi:hypothetical protein